MIRHLLAGLAVLTTAVLLSHGWPPPMAAVGGVLTASVALSLFLRSVRGAG